VRVGVDGRSLRASDGRGVARYLRFLLTALASAAPEDRYAVLVPGGRVPQGSAPSALPNVALRRTRIGGRPLFATATVTGRPRLDRMLDRPDVVWAPAVAPLAVSADVPLVVTVHDLSFEHRAADYSGYQRLWHRLASPRRLAQRANRLIAVSDTVRAQVIAEWELPPEKVVTVVSGPGRQSVVAPAASDEPGLTPGYVLAVGALEERKRPKLLVAAHRRARAAGLSAELVFAGEGPLREELAASGATVLGFVPDERLDDLYRDALVLACVSREEGFAFTPLEALAAGTPAVVADLPVFSETLGAGALRVPPGDPDALAAALLRVEQDRDLRGQLVAAGTAARARLSWERAAADTRAVLLDAAEAGP
jgi:glycosyltransferase involved in cell wall biosynthesis